MSLSERERLIDRRIRLWKDIRTVNRLNVAFRLIPARVFTLIKGRRHKADGAPPSIALSRPNLLGCNLETGDVIEVKCRIRFEMMDSTKDESYEANLHRLPAEMPRSFGRLQTTKIPFWLFGW